MAARTSTRPSISRRAADTAEIPLEQLVAPAVVIDVSATGRRGQGLQVDAGGCERVREAARADRARRDRAAADRVEPALARREGLSRATTRRATRRSCRFPSYGEEAARLLVEERGVAALGVDTASIDYGPSADFLVHRIAAARNVPGLENLTNLDQLPARGRRRDRAADEDRGRVRRSASRHCARAEVAELPVASGFRLRQSSDGYSS